MKIQLGTIGHFGLAVRDPRASAKWWRSLFDFEILFEDADYIGLNNPNVTIVLFQGVPHPKTIQHMSFHLPNMTALRSALELLKSHDVKVEDPGDEIGPEAEGSPNMGYGSTIRTAIVGNSRCRAAARTPARRPSLRFVDRREDEVSTCARKPRRVRCSCGRLAAEMR